MSGSAKTNRDSLVLCRAVLEPEKDVTLSSSASSAKATTKATNEPANDEPAIEEQQPRSAVKRLTKSEREKNAKDYEWTAWVSSCGIASLAITATYYRLLRDYNLDLDGNTGYPWGELVAQLALIAGAAVGMEFYARFAHKYLWHDVLWSMPMKYRKEWNRRIWMLHESHHLPREGAFEANDIFAVANGVPAFALCLYGFFTPGVVGGLCFGAGLGITFFGIAYMYVHDGMVHKRFPTGPLGKLPWLRRVASGHTIHHTEQFDGVPWGLFLGENELSRLEGGIEELDKVCAANDRADRRRELECLAAGNENIEDCEFNDGPIRSGVHIPSMKEDPQCVITSTGRRESGSENDANSKK